MSLLNEVADGVFLGRGTDVNWVLLREGSDVTLIDTGWAGDRPRLLASLESIGARPEDVRAILLTHAHVDHIGSVNHFNVTYRTPAYFDADEVAHARREFRQQATPADIARLAGRRGVLGWSARVARRGGLHDIVVAHARRIPAELDLPGRPVPVATHGHTAGHVAFHLPTAGAVVTGDALVTGHPVTGIGGPHLLGAPFDHDPVATAAALDTVAGLDAGVLLPGHGPVLRGPVADAVATARERAEKR